MTYQSPECIGCVNVECALSEFLSTGFRSGELPSDSETDNFVYEFTAGCPGKVYNSVPSTKLNGLLGKLGIKDITIACGRESELSFMPDIYVATDQVQENDAA